MDNIRQIASLLARDDPKSMESYPEYIRMLAALMMTSVDSFESLFAPKIYLVEFSEYDLLTAAAYTNKFSIVKDLSERSENTRVVVGTLGNPFKAATKAGQVAILDHLIRAVEQHGRSQWNVWWDQVCFASRLVSFKVVEHLLAYGWTSKMKTIFGYLDERFYRALFTPSVKMFGIFMQLKEATETSPKPMTAKKLAPLMLEAASNGWVEMMAHLIALGAPTHGEEFFTSYVIEWPLFKAVKFGCVGVVRLLLQHGVPITGNELRVAARRGNLPVVKVFIECGADVNCPLNPDLPGYYADYGFPLPIVSAVQLEYEEMFHLLLEHGAVLTGEAGVEAFKRAKESGLDSMLALLDQHAPLTGEKVRLD
jgi:hypothetical protein